MGPRDGRATEGGATSELFACVEVRVRVGRLARFALGVGYGASGFSALLFCMALAGGPLVGLLFATMATGALPLWLTFRQRVRRGGSVALSNDGVRVRSDGLDRTVSRRYVTGGYATLDGRTAVLRVQNGGELALTLASPAAEQVLDHVGFAVGGRALMAPLRGTLGAFTKGLLVAFACMMVLVPASIAALPSAGAPLGIVLSVVLTTAFVRRYGYPQAVVGSDGLRVEGGLRKRFVAFEAIERAELLESPVSTSANAEAYPGTGVLLTLRDRRTVLLPTIAQSRNERLALLRRIQEGMKTKGGDGEARLSVALDRRGRSAEAWKADLRKLALAAGGFRDQALGREDFERALSDPKSPLDRRVAAALALRFADPDAGPRIREASESAADEGVRAALEAASEGELHEVAMEERRVVKMDRGS